MSDDTKKYEIEMEINLAVTPNRFANEIEETFLDDFVMALFKGGGGSFTHDSDTLEMEAEPDGSNDMKATVSFEASTDDMDEEALIKQVLSQLEKFYNELDYKFNVNIKAYDLNSPPNVTINGGNIKNA